MCVSVCVGGGGEEIVDLERRSGRRKIQIHENSTDNLEMKVATGGVLIYNLYIYIYLCIYIYSLSLEESLDSPWRGVVSVKRGEISPELCGTYIMCQQLYKLLHRHTQKQLTR